MALNCRMCPDCLRHLRDNGRLQKRVRSLEGRVRRLQRQIEKLRRSPGEEPFGLNTPSSKIPVKPAAADENRARRGGRPQGHPGRSRRAFGAEGADRVERVGLSDVVCPECGLPLPAAVEMRTREYLELQRHRLNRIHCQLESRRCPRCRTRVTAPAPGVLPGQFFGNSLLARLAVAHYLDNHTFGFLQRHLGIGKSAVIQAMERLARLLGPMHPLILQQIRQAAVLFADETTWRSDGINGYAWAVFAEHSEAFLMRFSRAAAVATELFGQAPLPGTAVTDRLASYNHIPIRRQFCYAHLKRDLEQIVRDNPNSREARDFAELLLPLLARAMGLRTQPVSDPEYYAQAQALRGQILDACQRQARLPDVQNFQNIFRQHPHHLFHWVEDRAVPAENNRAERGVRPIVIARKISQGTQSDTGMQTMEVLLTVLRTLQLRTGNAEKALTEILDAVARNPSLTVQGLLPPVPAPSPPCAQTAA